MWPENKRNMVCVSDGSNSVVMRGKRKKEEGAVPGLTLASPTQNEESCSKVSPPHWAPPRTSVSSTSLISKPSLSTIEDRDSKELAWVEVFSKNQSKHCQVDKH